MMIEDEQPSAQTSSGDSLPADSALKKKRGKPGARRATGAKKKKPSKRAKTRTPRARSPKGGAMAAAGRYVLVIHMTAELQKKMDREVAKLQKKHPDERISRSSYARALVEKALR